MYVALAILQKLLLYKIDCGCKPQSKHKTCLLLSVYGRYWQIAALYVWISWYLQTRVRIGITPDTRTNYIAEMNKLHIL